MSETKKLNPLEISLYMLDAAIADISKMQYGRISDTNESWDALHNTIKESQKHIQSTMCHLRAIYEEIHGEDAYDKGFTKEETIDVLESWSVKAHCYDSILEALSLPAQEDYSL